MTDQETENKEAVAGSVNNTSSKAADRVAKGVVAFGGAAVLGATGLPFAVELGKEDDDAERQTSHVVTATEEPPSPKLLKADEEIEPFSVEPNSNKDIDQEQETGRG